jgi:hypothetical protein
MMLQCKQLGAMAPGIAAGLWRRLAATEWSEPGSRAGVSPAGVQRLSRRTFSPTTDSCL